MCESEIEVFVIHLGEDLSNKEDWPFIVISLHQTI